MAGRRRLERNGGRSQERSYIRDAAAVLELFPTGVDRKRMGLCLVTVLDCLLDFVGSGAPPGRQGQVDIIPAPIGAWGAPAPRASRYPRIRSLDGTMHHPSQRSCL